MESIEVTTKSRTEAVDITEEVQAAVSRSQVSQGIVLVSSLHTTAGMTVNEHADPDVMDDLMGALDRLAPRRGSYAHSEGNSDAHIKATLVGLSVSLPVESGRASLGTWQGIFFCEFDGPRRRRVLVQVVPAGS
jgi:secondary thiamine-phosphate synthase enzyme